jgi:hypothetical protein
MRAADQNPGRGNLPGRSALEAVLPAVFMRDMLFIRRPLNYNPIASRSIDVRYRPWSRFSAG